jgi:hypothetical protein
MRNVLGVSEENNQRSIANEDNSFLNTLELQNIISLFPTQIICVRSSDFQMENFNSSDNSCSSLAVLHNNVGQNQMMIYQNNNPINKYTLGKSNTTNFQIDITDINGNLLDLNGCHWFATFMYIITYEIPDTPNFVATVENNKKRSIEEISQMLEEMQNE